MSYVRLAAIALIENRRSMFYLVGLRGVSSRGVACSSAAARYSRKSHADSGRTAIGQKPSKYRGFEPAP